MEKLLVYTSLFLILVAPGCASVQPDRQYILSEGDEFIITLEANPSTGYQWKIEEGLSGSGLLLLEESYQPADKPADRPIVGAGGTKKWKFRGVQRGKTMLKMVYQRPGEEKPAEIRYFQIKIR